MKVQEIMTRSPVCIQPDETMWAVKRIFDKYQFHHILVVEQSALVGVLSDRDYLKTVSPHVKSGALTSRDLASMSKKAHQIMSRDVISIQATDSVMQAVMLFNQHRISCLPVLNGHKLTGILSWRDIMRYLQDRVMTLQKRAGSTKE